MASAALLAVATPAGGARTPTRADPKNRTAPQDDAGRDALLTAALVVTKI
jgi:hypothetical protein